MSLTLFNRTLLTWCNKPHNIRTIAMMMENQNNRRSRQTITSPAYTSKKVVSMQFYSLTKRFESDMEYLGGISDTGDAEEWQDVIIDGPLIMDNEIKFRLKDIGPCPDGMTNSAAFATDKKIICLNKLQSRLEYFDPSIDLWTAGLDKLPFTIDSSKKNQFQFARLTDDKFVIWSRKNLEDIGKLNLYSISDSTYKSLTAPTMSLKYRKYARIISAGTHLLMQTRYRTERDSLNYLWDGATFDIDPFDKTESEFAYTTESYYSKLFYYHFGEQVWKELDLKGCNMPVCYAHTVSPCGRYVYFLSSLNNGYRLDTQTWTIKPLGLIGRPESLTWGSSLAASAANNSILCVGGARRSFDEERVQDGIIGKIIRSTAITKLFRRDEKKLFKDRKKADQKVIFEVPKKLASYTDYFNDIIYLDMNKKRWVLPFIEKDESWPNEGLGFSSVVSFGSNYYIFGGENVSGQVKRVWKLEKI
eukprot:TRINITY_DN2406_c0_g1_i1.p1 TRINITY_DN2406_c0_g1~~TRINITY_DN2406_c0_g1_i1.p1  ORF type:complete len:474 (+),score=86.77 TRINITY_DN2406_c0_g1_i1:73-1494(+)